MHFIKIKLNGKIKKISSESNLLSIVNSFNIPLDQIAIEFNGKILNKKNLNEIKISNNDQIEIIQMLGGG